MIGREMLTSDEAAADKCVFPFWGLKGGVVCCIARTRKACVQNVWYELRVSCESQSHVIGAKAKHHSSQFDGEPGDWLLLLND